MSRVQLPGEPTPTHALRALRQLRGTSASGCSSGAAAAGVRLLPEVLARLQPARRARRHQRHRAAAVHQARARQRRAPARRAISRCARGSASRCCKTRVDGRRAARAARGQAGRELLEDVRAAAKAGARRRRRRRRRWLSSSSRSAREELPARFAARARRIAAGSTSTSAPKAQAKAQRGDIPTFGTPRRLALLVTGSPPERPT